MMTHAITLLVHTLGVIMLPKKHIQFMNMYVSSLCEHDNHIQTKVLYPHPMSVMHVACICAVCFAASDAPSHRCTIK